jgi:acyl carrier protein
MFARADWTRFISDIGMTPSILSRFEQATSASGGFGDALQGMSASEQAERVQQIVLKTAKATLHIDTLAADAPLMEAGMDSLTAVEFRNKLTQELPGVKLASTLMFDYPNVEAIATFALGQIAPSAAAASKPIARVATISHGSSETLAVLGMACHFPGRCDSPERLFENLLAGVDGVIEIPNTRFDIDEYFDPKMPTPGKMYVRKAAFIEGVELFDAAFFGISAAEAKTMDPQQRLLLEVIYEAFHQGGLDRKALLGSYAGIFVGQCNNDWGHMQFGNTEKMNPFSGTGLSASISANRVSYTLGVKGPSAMVDTACSSSLVALDACSAASPGPLLCRGCSRGELEPHAGAVRGVLPSPNAVAGRVLQDFRRKRERLRTRRGLRSGSFDMHVDCGEFWKADPCGRARLCDQSGRAQLKLDRTERAVAARGGPRGTRRGAGHAYGRRYRGVPWNWNCTRRSD